MNDHIIKEIIELAFIKAKRVIATPKKKTICIEISEAFDGDSNINSVTYKTIERVYDKYVLGKSGGVPKNETIDYLCIYLEYESFSDFLKKNKKLSNKPLDKKAKNIAPKTGVLKKILVSLIIISVITPTLLLTFYRRTTITTNQNKGIILYSHKNNTDKKLGVLTEKNNFTLNVWLKVGESDLYFYGIKDYNQEYPGSESIKVKPFWKSMSKIILSKI